MRAFVATADSKETVIVQARNYSVFDRTWRREVLMLQPGTGDNIQAAVDEELRAIEDTPGRAESCRGSAETTHPDACAQSQRTALESLTPGR